MDSWCLSIFGATTISAPKSSLYLSGCSGWMELAQVFSLFGKGWEQDSSHLWDGLLVGHGETVIKGLGANNSILFGVDDEASEA